MKYQTQLILCSNGFANNGHSTETPGLAEEMKALGIKKVLHIGWASNGLTIKESIQNTIAISKMIHAGFSVDDLPLNQNLAEVNIDDYDSFYLNGGNPITLRMYLRTSGLDAVLQKTKKTIIGASAGAMVLGNSLFLGRFAPTAHGLPPYLKQDWHGLGCHPFTVVPHKESVIKKLGRILIIPDGKYFSLGI